MGIALVGTPTFLIRAPVSDGIPMTSGSPPRLAPLGMLLWWAATSSAMPLDTPAGAPYEADGPDAHKLSLQPVGRGAHLDFERRRATETCLDMDNDENWC